MKGELTVIPIIIIAVISESNRPAMGSLDSSSLAIISIITTASGAVNSTRSVVLSGLVFFLRSFFSSSLRNWSSVFCHCSISLKGAPALSICSLMAWVLMAIWAKNSWLALNISSFRGDICPLFFAGVFLAVPAAVALPPLSLIPVMLTSSSPFSLNAQTRRVFMRIWRQIWWIAKILISIFFASTNSGIAAARGLKSMVIPVSSVVR